MDLTLIYDLAFIAPKRRPRTPPELVFIINKKHLPELIKRLLAITENLRLNAADYLGDEDSSFKLPTPDLFGKVEFGYGHCGYTTTDKDEVHLHLQLKPGISTQYCSLTIHALTMAFAGPFETPTGANRTQGVVLHTVCERNKPGGYGHAVGGWLTESVNSWLKEYGSKYEQNLGLITAAPMHSEVVSAMQATWHSICSEDTRKYASTRETYGYVRKDGSFLLVCFGNACDMGIYPDSVRHDDKLANLSCHNLDHSAQQLTLLAGLSKMCQLARDCS